MAKNHLLELESRGKELIRGFEGRFLKKSSEPDFFEESATQNVQKLSQKKQSLRANGKQ